MKTGWRTRTTLSVLGVRRITDSLKERAARVLSVVIFAYLQEVPDQLSANACTNRPWRPLRIGPDWLLPVVWRPGNGVRASHVYAVAGVALSAKRGNRKSEVLVLHLSSKLTYRELERRDLGHVKLTLSGVRRFERIGLYFLGAADMLLVMDKSCL